MSTFLHAVLPLIGRVVAGAVGCYCFYVAVFMYKDEKQRWQNRLDSIWVEIDERAQKTDSVFTALINRVSSGTVNVFNLLFGDEAFSLKLMAVSANLSLLCAQMSELSYLYLHYWSPPVRLFHAVFEVGLTVLLLACASLAICFRERLIIHLGCLVPSLMYFAYEFHYTFRRLGHGVDLPFAAVYPLSGMFAASMSCVVDVLALVTIRKSFARLEKVSTVVGALLLSLLLFLVAWCACVLPSLVSHDILFQGKSLRTGIYSRALKGFGLFDAWTLRSLGLFDEVTCLYCVVPCIVLFGLVIHKILWPLLARFTYPLLDFKVLTERKFLIPIGTVAFALAFGYTTVSDLLKKYLTK